jgi:hypothetical protein
MPSAYIMLFQNLLFKVGRQVSPFSQAMKAIREGSGIALLCF